MTQGTDGYFQDQDYIRFHYNFWLCTYVVSIGFLMLAALIWIPVPQENQSMANLAMGFITATIIGLPLAYSFGGNPAQAQQNKQKPGTVTLDASVTATTETPKDNDPPQ